MGGGVGLYRSLQQGAGSLNIRRLLLINGDQISQEIQCFSMRKHKSLGSLKSLLSYASQLFGVSILRFDFSHP